MGQLLRLMPDYDPHWRERLETARARRTHILANEGRVSAEQQRELRQLRTIINDALQRRFRTTAEYRDHRIAGLRLLMDQEGLDVDIPILPDDATVDAIDTAITQAWRQSTPYNPILQAMLGAEYG